MWWCAGRSLLRAEGFSCSLDVQFCILKKKLIFTRKYSQFLVIEFLDPDPDWYQVKMLDPDTDPESMKPDPKHCFKGSVKWGKRG